MRSGRARGPTGVLRFFGTDFGTQISWLIPAALVLAVACLWLWRRRPRTDPARSAMLLWSGWLVVTVLVISLAQGIIHPYYSVAAAPAIGAMVGIGSSALWERRAHLGARIGLAVALVATAVWGYVLLDRAPQWMPWLAPAVVTVALVAAVVLVLAPRLRGRTAMALGAVGVSAALAGPSAYALDTAATAHSGAIPSAGPASSSGPGGAPGAPGGGFAGIPAGGFGGRGASAGAAGSRFPRSAGAALPPGIGTTNGAPIRSGATGAGVANGSFPSGGFGGPPATGRAGGAGALPRGRGGAASGGFLSISTPGAKLVKALETDAGNYTWVAATVNSNSAAGYQLATDDPVMAIGGFNGTDPAPTLAQFERYVASKKIHYFIAGGGGPGNGTSGSTAGQITQWVENHFTAQTLDGVTLYDLSSQ